MAQATNFTATAFANGTVVTLARIKDLLGVDVTSSSLNSIKYTVYSLGKTGQTTRTAVTGHNNVTLTLANVFYDTIQTITVDGTTINYNFRFTLDNSTNQCFPNANEKYLVRIDFYPSSGFISPIQVLVSTI